MSSHEAELVAHRRGRVFAELERGEIDALVLSGSSNARYATGAYTATGDESYHHAQSVIAILVTRHRLTYVASPSRWMAPLHLATIVEPIRADTDAGVRQLAELLRGHLDGASRIAADELSAAAFLGLPKLLPDLEIVDASSFLGAAKIIKSDEEIARIDAAQRINELAMYEVLPQVRPGVRQSELSGIFLEAAYRLGTTGNVIDPIWQPMTPRIADGPFTPHADLAFPTPSTDRILVDGDLVFVDTGLDYRGYASDFGRTWVVGIDPRPSPALRSLFQRWLDVMDAVRDACRPGRTGRDLVNIAVEANGGTRPWMKHFYLGHGIGTDSAEMPLIGTDLGDEFDESIVLAPGMTIVLEPAVWQDGVGGYRAEEIVAVTSEGPRVLGSDAFPYWPFS